MVKVTRRRSRKWKATCSCGWDAGTMLSYFDASQAANAHRLVGMKKPGTGSRHLTVISRALGPGAE